MKIDNIKVLGTGCKSCHTLLKNVQKAVDELGLPIAVEYVTDLQKIMAYGAMHMPALVVNDRVAAQGAVLTPKEIAARLQKEV